MHVFHPSPGQGPQWSNFCAVWVTFFSGWRAAAEHAGGPGRGRPPCAAVNSCRQGWPVRSTRHEVLDGRRLVLVPIRGRLIYNVLFIQADQQIQVKCENELLSWVRSNLATSKTQAAWSGLNHGAHKDLRQYCIQFLIIPLLFLVLWGGVHL